MISVVVGAICLSIYVDSLDAYLEVRATRRRGCRGARCLCTALRSVRSLCRQSAVVIVAAWAKLVPVPDAVTVAPTLPWNARPTP